MLEFKVNGSQYQLGTPIESFGEIRYIELNYNPMFTIQVPIGQATLIADYLWRLTQSINDEALIIVNQVIMYKTDIKKYKGI